jgi:tetratricopeptide (TPR) repeat protein
VQQPPPNDLAALGNIYRLDSNPEWGSLLASVEFSSAFTFLVLLVPDAAGASLCRQQLRARMGQAELGGLEDHFPKSRDEWSAVLQRLVHGQTPPGTGAVWVEAAVPDHDSEFAVSQELWRWAAGQLNQFRNPLERGVGCVLIFVGCDWLKPLLREHAPDLWSIRSSVIEIRPPAAVVQSPTPTPVELVPDENAPDPEMALRQAEILRGRLAKIFDPTVEPGPELALAQALARAGAGFNARFEYLKAIPLWRESLALRKKFRGSPRAVLHSMRGLWDPLYQTGELDEAFALAKEIELAATGLNDQSAKADAYRRISWIMIDRGELGPAMGYQKQVEAICRELGDRSGLGMSLGNQALILKAWGRLDEAMALHKEQERICRELGDRASLQASLGNQALILKAWGRLDEAMALHKEQERICLELGDRSGLNTSLGNQALILQAWGRLEEAMALHKEEERICRELGDRSGLQRSLGNQAVILQAWGRLEEAMALHKEEERICRELGDRSGLGASLGNQAGILKAWGRLDEAMALHKEEERICRELGDRSGLAYSLANQGQLHRRFQPPDLTAARRLLTEAVRLMTEIGMPQEREQWQGWLDEIPPPAK